MKKILFLGIVFSGLCTVAFAQPAATSSSEGRQTAEQKPSREQMVESLAKGANISMEKAEKVTEINWAIRREAGAGLNDLSASDRDEKLKALKAEKEKRYLEVLTQDELKMVYAYYENMGKQKH